jgi:hypothetical protein
MRKDYRGLPLTETYTFDVELVSTVISKLSLGKAAGLGQLIAERFICSNPIISCILCKLFNLM